MILDSKGKSTDPSYLGQGGKRPSSTNLDDIEMKRYEQVKKLFTDETPFRGISATIFDLKKNWEDIAKTMYTISKSDAVKIDEIFEKIGTRQDLMNMKQSDLLKLYKEYETAMDNILKRKEEMFDLSVDEEEAIKRQSDIQKRLSRDVGAEKEGGRKGAVADVLRSAGQIPGLGMVGEIGGMMAGGFTVATVIDGIGKLIRMMDSFIGQEREFRRAMAMPGLVMPPNISEEIGTDIHDAMVKAGIPDVTKEGIVEALKSLKGIPGLVMSEGVTGPVSLIGGIKDSVREIGELTEKGMRRGLDVIMHGGTFAGGVADKRQKEYLESFEKRVKETITMPESTEQEITAKRVHIKLLQDEFKVRQVGLALTEEENNRYNKLFSDVGNYSSNLANFMVSITRLQNATGVSAQETISSLKTMSDAGVQLGRTWEDWLTDLYAVQVASRGVGRVYEEYLPDVINTFNRLKYFGLVFQDANAIVDRWSELLRKGSVSLQDLNDAYERAKGVMPLDELMLDFQMMSDMVEKGNNEGLKNMFDYLKQSPEKMSVFYRALLEGGNAMTALESKFGIGVKDELVKAAGGTEKFKEAMEGDAIKGIEGVASMRERVIDSFYKVASAGDPVAEMFMRMYTPVFGIEKGATGQPIEKWVDQLNVQSQILTGGMETYSEIASNLTKGVNTLSDEIKSYTESTKWTETAKILGDKISLAVGSEFGRVMKDGKMNVVIVGVTNGIFGPESKPKNERGAWLFDQFNNPPPVVLPIK